SQLISMVGLEGKEDSYPWQLSGGEQQRTGIARALANQPLILIADEPTGNLDMDTSWGIMELLFDINRKGTTVIMATHARELVRAARKRVITLEKGRIVSDILPGEFAV
ncbi:MAG: ATP-binding cassette domain-containing protein, partial [Syntrophomonadaceae bacterium]|nr:ATP-binding cassette domain-containing protein [Syntrophomonadaceae bacterium]